jgi:RimJ/RimL family protein N-acetyltransferase
MRKYKALSHQIFSSGEYQLVPIRHEDRLMIMQWRNEQMYHLRQSEAITIETQNLYFENVISNIFDQENPDQILFSFLKDNVCVGYGGLVHINWVDSNAEISFVMDTKLELQEFEIIWRNFYGLLEKVAHEGLVLHKLYTYAYDLRPRLYPLFESFGFKQEARLKEHILYSDRYIDVVIHGKII